MPAPRLPSRVGRCLAAVVVAALVADAAWGFFPSLPPTNRVTGGGPQNQTPPSNQTPPGGPPPPPPPPPSQPVTPGFPNSPPASSPPGSQGPPVAPVILPSGGITPTPPSPPGPIPEVSAHGLTAGLALTLCGILMITDRRRKHKALPPAAGQ